MDKQDNRYFGFKDRRGFSLIELSFVLIATAFMVAGALQVYKIYQINQAENQMIETMRDVRASLNEYIDNDTSDDAQADPDSAWQRYPCPASPNLSPSDPNFGLEVRTAADGDCDNINGVIRVTTGPEDILIGAVPLRDVEGRTIMSRDGAIDAYNNLMTYAVTENLTRQDARANGMAGAITIVDDVGPADPVTTRAEYVVISHGANSSATCPAPGANTGDAENCDFDDDIFADNLRNVSGGADSYDDWLVYTLSPVRDKEWWLGVNQGETIVSLNPGNVGIATTDPQEKLDIGSADLNTGQALRVTDGNIVLQSAIMYVSQGRAFATQGEIQVGFADRECVNKSVDDDDWNPDLEALPGTIRYNSSDSGWPEYNAGDFVTDTYPGHEYCLYESDTGIACWAPVTHDDYTDSATISYTSGPCSECGSVGLEVREVCPGVDREFIVEYNCQPYCTEETDTRTRDCPVGQASLTPPGIVEFRSKTCPGGDGSCPPVGTWGPWVESTNTCQPACDPNDIQRRPAECPDGQDGTAYEERTVIDCPDAVTTSWSPWQIADISECTPAGCGNEVVDWSGGISGLNCSDSTGVADDGDPVSLSDTDGNADYRCDNGTWIKTSSLCRDDTGDPVCVSWNDSQTRRQCGGGSVLFTDSCVKDNTFDGCVGSDAENPTACMAACNSVEGATCCESRMEVIDVDLSTYGRRRLWTCNATTATVTEPFTTSYIDGTSVAKLCADMSGGGASCSGPESGCAGQQVFWSGCDGFTSDSCHADSATVTPTDPAYNGSATFECNDGSWFQVGSGTCTPPPSTPACGTAAGTNRTTMPSGSAACSVGTQINQTTNLAGDTPPYSFQWDCQADGTTAPCIANTVNDGACGGAQAGDPPTANAPSFDNICDFHDSVTAAGNPDPAPTAVAGRWRWNCYGSHGGTLDRCYKTMASPPSDQSDCNTLDDPADNGNECTGNALFTTYYDSFTGLCHEDCNKVNGVSCCELNDNGSWHVCRGKDGSVNATGDGSSWADSCSAEFGSFQWRFLGTLGRTGGGPWGFESGGNIPAMRTAIGYGLPPAPDATVDNFLTSEGISLYPALFSEETSCNFPWDPMLASSAVSFGACGVDGDICTQYNHTMGFSAQSNEGIQVFGCGPSF